jgi:hypothetical protein
MIDNGSERYFLGSKCYFLDDVDEWNDDDFDVLADDIPFGRIFKVQWHSGWSPPPTPNRVRNGSALISASPPTASKSCSPVM